MSSLCYRPENPLCVMPTANGKVGLLDADHWLRNLGLEKPPGEESQALRQCPDIVRLAIASHFTWWFLARAHSTAVRTLAHAFFGACKAPVAALAQAFAPPAGGCARVGVIGTFAPKGNAPVPVMSHRVLHYFGRYLQEAAASGVNANQMQKKDWLPHLRPGVRAYSEHRHMTQDIAMGCVGAIDHDDYKHAIWSGVFVRSSASRWADYKAGAITAMQPFFSAEMRPDKTPDECGTFAVNRAVTVPKVQVTKPRSKRFVAMIPRHLAYGMEQVGAELPYCVRDVQYQREWRDAILREVAFYVRQREEAALLAMANRDPMNPWLKQYDTIAAINYGMPAVEGRNVGMSVSNIPFNSSKDVLLRFPGICENNIT
jgi:hypothetical protein